MWVFNPSVEMPRHFLGRLAKSKWTIGDEIWVEEGLVKESQRICLLVADEQLTFPACWRRRTSGIWPVEIGGP